jgi:hypothetical protein
VLHSKAFLIKFRKKFKKKKKIEGLRAKTLSQASRLVLIKSMAAAIPSYAMSSFILPKSIYSKLHQSFKNFWRGFPPTKTRNLSLKSWDSLCLPKAIGGLGFRKLKDVNLALISKLGRNLHTNLDSMWMAQMRGKYLSTGSFLSPPPYSSPSRMWKGILSSQGIISLGACHRIHKLIFAYPRFCLGPLPVKFHHLSSPSLLFSP